MFYVYEWFVIETGEVFYVGKGTGRRYKVRKHNKFFDNFVKRFECDSRIVKSFSNEEEAFEYEFEHILELKMKGQCVCNINVGGVGGTTKWWTDEKRKEYSKNNVMKSNAQRKRMSDNNPMKDPKIAAKTNSQKKKKVCVGSKVYDSLLDVAKEFGVGATAVGYWLKRGYTRNLEPCYYFGEPIPKVVLNKGRYAGKPVIVDGKRFDTVKAASKYINVDPSILVKALKSNQLCKGHICRYDNQQPSQTNTDKSSLEGSTTNE